VAESELRQKLAAILAADAVGYSRLMAEDEHGTVGTLHAAQEVFRRHIESNRGKVVGMPGDFVLALFETAIGAVTAALAIQEDLPGASSATERQRLPFRIGVHLGDVIEKADGSVYGDGVNIAARLQALADAGGVLISDAVHSAVRGKVTATFVDHGEHRIKNIPHPIHAFRVAHVGDEAKPVVPTGTEPALPDRPSIVVLPFANMSDDPRDDYFADGITEDITTELARFGRLFVIARNTSFTFRGQSVDAQKVGRQLGVHFLLEGSVRRSNNRIRITAQLIEATSGAHTWAEHYDDVIDDVFDVQERITRQVVASTVPQIEAEEMRLLERGPRRFTAAHDVSWRAMKALMDSYFKGDSAPAIEAARLAEAAIRQDPKCALAYYVVAASHAWRVFMGWAENRREALVLAQRAADTLMILAPNESQSYFARACVALLSGYRERGMADLRKALELNPNDASVMFYLSWAEAAAGNVARARQLAAQALRMSPRDIWVGVAHLGYAIAAFLERKFDELRGWAELAIQSHPAAPIRRVLMIAYAAEVGDVGLLKHHREKLEMIAPDFIPSLVRGDYEPFHRPEHTKMLLESLGKARTGI
jgi:adenylate cyclase